jgi:hypothetical protein
VLSERPKPAGAGWRVAGDRNSFALCRATACLRQSVAECRDTARKGGNGAHRRISQPDGEAVGLSPNSDFGETTTRVSQAATKSRIRPAASNAMNRATPARASV